MKWTFTVLISLLLFSPLFSQNTLDKGLILHMAMDGDALDESEYQNDGNIKGKVKTAEDRFGISCGALKFNGNDGFITIPNSPSLQSPSNQLSVAVWLKIDEVCNYADRDWFTILCKSDQGFQDVNSPQYRIQGSPMTLSLQTDEIEIFERAIKFNFDDWNFYTVTYDGKEVIIYFNGIRHHYFEYAETFTVNDYALEIGRDKPGNSEYFCGTMDDLRLYNRALTEQEIDQLYKAKPKNNEVGKLSMSCPGDMTIQTGAESCDAIVTYRRPKASDNCSELDTKLEEGPESGTLFPIGITRVRYSASSPAGNYASCSFEVRVVDTQKPKMNCPENVSVKAEPGAEIAVVEYNAPSSTDNCLAATLDGKIGPSSGSEFPIGKTEIVFTSMDKSGNAASCSFSIEVLGVDALQIICPKNVNISTDNDLCYAVLEYPDPVLVEADPEIMVVLKDGLASGSKFQLGETTITFEVNDPENRVAECSFKIKVEDQELPVLHCPKNQLVQTDPGEQTATVVFDEPYATDNCQVAQFIKTEGLESGSNFPIGNTKVVYSATDKAGNTAQCEFSVQVDKVVDLKLSCPENIVTSTDPGACQTSVSHSPVMVLGKIENVLVTQREGIENGSKFPVGITKMIYTAVHPSGKDVDCYFEVFVKDSEKPVIDCPKDIRIKATPGKNEMAVEYTIPTATDNCSEASVTLEIGPESGSSFPVGTTAMKLVATDVSKNITECNFSITVESVEMLGLQCPENIEVFVGRDACTAKVEYNNPALTKQVEGAVIELKSGRKSGENFDIGEHIITFSASDAFDQAALCNFKINVRDTISPAITCPQNLIVNAAPNDKEVAVTYTLPTANDNCGKATVSLSAGQQSGEIFPIGTNKVNYQATDEAGNTKHCNFEITVKGVDVLALKCSEDIIVYVGQDDCKVKVNYEAATLIAKNEEASVSLNEGLASGSKFALGSHTIRYAAGDNFGQKANCDFNIEVKDTVAPGISCPQDLKLKAAPGETEILVKYDEPKAFDNCGSPTVELIEGAKSGSMFPVGNTLMTYKVSDKNGNSFSCNFTVNIEGLEVLSISCPDDITTNNDPGTCSAKLNYPSPRVNDAYEGVLISRNKEYSSGSEFPIGLTEMTYTASEPSGQNAVCSFKVQVNDIENPQINCPADIQISTKPGEVSSKVEYALPSAADNCGDPDISIVNGPASGSNFPIGSTSLSFLAEDGFGNKAECSFKIRVKAVGVLSVECPDNIELTADIGTCDKAVTFDLPTVPEEFAGVNIQKSEGPESGTRFKVGKTRILYEARDGSGQTATCSFQIFITDNENPAINCPRDIVVNTVPGQEFAKVDYAIPTATDNCGKVDVVLLGGPVSGSEFSIGKTEIKFNAKDAGGNTNGCLFNIRVEGLDKLVLTCPNNVSVNTDPGQCDATVKYDAYGGSGLQDATVDLIEGIESNGKFPVGITKLTYAATHPSGQEANCSFEVSVKDVEAPKLNCPENIQVSTKPGDKESIIEYSGIVASDNCGLPDVTQVSGLKSGDAFPIGFTQIKYDVKDRAGNVTSCEFSVEVKGLDVLSLKCPANINKKTDAGTCTAKVDFTSPLAGAKFPDANILMKEGMASAELFPVGNTKIVFTADEPLGQKAECTFKVTIKDEEIPTIKCPSPITKQTKPGEKELLITYENPTASDNCSSGEALQLTMTSGFASGAAFPVGVTDVMYIAKDASGNEAKCNFVVNIKGLDVLALNCPLNVVVNTDPGSCTAKIDYKISTTGEGLEGVKLTQSEGLKSGENFPLGLTNIAYEVKDGSGQSAECKFVVIVSDKEKPVLICPDDLRVQTKPGEKNALVSFKEPRNLDNCGNVKLERLSGAANGTKFAIGTTLMEFIAIDESGNKEECSFNIEVAELQMLAISCPEDIKADAAPGMCGSKVKFEIPTLLAAIAGAKLSQSEGLAAGSEFPVGLTKMTYSASDQNDQNANCNFQIEIFDIEKPLVTCPKNIKLRTEPGELFAIVDYILPTATDNCGNPSLKKIKGLDSGAKFPSGITEVSYLVEDKSGNASICEFNVEVDPVGKLTLVCPDNVSVVAEDALCDALVTYKAPAPEGGISGVKITPPTSGKSGSRFNEGVTILSYQATDPTGQHAECSFEVRVRDVQKPSITCPEDKKIRTAPGEKEVVVDYSAAIASDNCGKVDIRVAEGLKSGSTFPIGENIIIYSAMDNSGNVSECILRINVGATATLRLACPPDLKLKTNPDKCTAIAKYPKAKQVGGVAGASISLQEGPGSGEAFPIGTTNVIFKASDESGAMANCDFKVRVFDREKPKIKCPEDINTFAAGGKTSSIVKYDSPKTKDNCGISEFAISDGFESGQSFPLGGTSVTYSAKDEAGNSVSCTFNVIVKEAKVAFEEADVPKELDGVKVNYQNSIMVKSADITVYYYDHADRDGDVISLNYDGEWVVNKSKLKKKTKDIKNTPNVKLHLEPKEVHYLISKAHNLGSGGINTLTLAIYDGKSSPRLIKLESKIGASGAIKIAYDGN